MIIALRDNNDRWWCGYTYATFGTTKIAPCSLGLSATSQPNRLVR
jgi:hypothetical protein